MRPSGVAKITKAGMSTAGTIVGRNPNPPNGTRIAPATNR